jgi:hypothetical protein
MSPKGIPLALHSHELPSIVDTACAEAAYHPVAIGCHLLLDVVADVGEDSMNRGDTPYVALAASVFVAGSGL